MELQDLYDAQRRPLHKTHWRGQKKQPGEYSVAVAVWVVDSARQLLLTLRAPEKEEYPNKWAFTVGAVLAGENSLQAAVRELAEETGIAAAPEEFIFFKSFREHSAFFDVYLLRRDVAVSALTMQAGETVAAKWVSLPQLDAMVADGSLALPDGWRLAQVRGEFEAWLSTL